MSMCLNSEQTDALLALGNYLAALQPILRVLAQQAPFSAAVAACRDELEAATHALFKDVQLRPETVGALHRAVQRVLDLQCEYLAAAAATILRRPTSPVPPEERRSPDADASTITEVMAARARASYHDPHIPPRCCDRCGRSYTGPAVYCSLACALADA